MNTKWLISLSRVAVLTACAIWFMTQTPGVRAMGCATYNTQNNEELCPGCCSSFATGNDWTDGTTNGPGIQNLVTQYANCGSCTSTCQGGTNCGFCGTQGWYQAVNDPSCCLPSGFACNQGTCCSGLVCLSSGSCGACVDQGQACGADSDCCSGNCLSGLCSKCPVGCTPVGNTCSCCPIVLDTTGQGFKLTDVAHGAYFRWQSDGPRYAMSWTDPSGGNGWLVLPNANGQVVDATNMFTSVTPQPHSAYPNGFVALAVYDLPSEGGNNNGWIDPGDAIYSKLRVWIDANQDGLAQPRELHTLDDVSIERIGLRYRLAEKVDQYGNTFRFVSQVLEPSDARDYDVWIKLDPDRVKW